MLIPERALSLTSFFCLFSLPSFIDATPSLGRFARQSPRDPCPTQCGLSGSSPANWTVYHSLNTLELCDRPMLLDFVLEVPVDRSGSTPRIRACSIWGDSIPVEDTSSSVADFLPTNALTHVQNYLQNLPSADVNSIMFSKQGDASVGYFGGSQFDTQRIAESILGELIRDLIVDNSSTTVLQQLCGTDRNSQQTWGVAVALGRPLSAAQSAVRTWSHGSCVQDTSTIDSLVESSFSSTLSNSTQMVTIYESDKVNGSQSSVTESGEDSDLQRRAECSTEQVIYGDGCDTLAARCGITPATFTEYNDDDSLCGNLKPGQHVCCSSGTLPDYAPQENDDGSCSTYTVAADDTCSDLAAAYDLTEDEILSFNTDTWGWNGCDPLWAGSIICLSTGDPPMPASMENAVCGPQVPGTEAPTNGTDLADLNPCPLNACCDIWGQCGITAEFCTESESETGAPGTAASEQNGCISNCGTNIVTSTAPKTYRQVGYFEGYNFDRDCLYMDASQLDTDTLTHVHFAFGTLTEDFEVGVGNDHSAFQFERFKLVSGPLRILSIGGWSFSTDVGTYSIFRNVVQSENVDTATTNIANFINANGLDGVDIDWEYPGAPDIPGIPAGADDEGELYTKFIKRLKSKLSDKSVSIAAPASYWYLRPYEMDSLGEIVDYVVFMTYDLHGQWDYNNNFASPGCDNGNCLRSHVNFTETVNTLSMITKAGVPSNKVVVGVSSYGRSFKMTTAGCTGPDCTYEGTESEAYPGPCTQTNGYIANAEISEIIATNPTATTSTDESFSNILVYNETEWVSYMDKDNKADRDLIYTAYSMGGSVNWAVDLAEFNDVPADAYDVDSDGSQVLLETWASIVKSVDQGTDPFVHGDRNGNWTNVTCSDRAVQGALDIPADQRWSELDCDDAWADAVQVYKDYYPKKYFTTAISTVYHGPENMKCGLLSETSNCNAVQTCEASYTAEGAGAGGYEIINSLVAIQGMYQDLYNNINSAETQVLYDIDTFFSTFSPIPDYTMAFNLIMDSLGLLVPTAMAPILNSELSATRYFTAHPDRLDTAKDIAYTAVGTWVNIAKDSNAGDYGWDEDMEVAFKSYMGDVWRAWKNSTEMASKALFNGSDSTTTLLTRMMSEGKLIEGSSEGNDDNEVMSGVEQEYLIEKTFYAYVIPQVWQKSSQNVFVVDTGHDCDDSNPISDYVSDDTADVTGVCFNDKRYYLVHLDGTASNSCQDEDGGNTSGTSFCIPYKFSVPPGADTLGTTLDSESVTAWGGLEVLDIVAASVNAYTANGNKNGWSIKGLSSYSTVQDIEDASLITQTVRAAGHNTLPVCSATEAFLNWGTNLDLENYPCNDS
ncbi:hypothetical protein N7456_002555 [Penicillium angulare]|uniref:chitinase n=1 Tax=Penicillium angulare TaxID=116970 RepID=A0A9W9G8I6_9EURO|nr:hypothetical protein N7456_002555 [Penicillium angulare]